MTRDELRENLRDRSSPTQVIATAANARAPAAIDKSMSSSIATTIRNAATGLSRITAAKADPTAYLRIWLTGLLGFI
jgi:hypothetical protein